MSPPPLVQPEGSVNLKTLGAAERYTKAEKTFGESENLCEVMYGNPPIAEATSVLPPHPPLQ